MPVRPSFKRRAGEFAGARAVDVPLQPRVAPPVSAVAPVASPSSVPLPANEAERIVALRALEVLDAAGEKVFDQIAAQAALICGVPIALISLVDDGRQWFLARHGTQLTQTPREASLCAHAITGEGVLEVDDLSADPRFAHNPFVTGAAQLRFYAGAPIVLPGGEAIGTVCALAPHVHRLDASQRALLESLAALAATLLLERRERLALARDLGRSDARYRTMIEGQTDLVALVDVDGRIAYANMAFADVFSEAPEALVGRSFLDFVVDADRAALNGQLRLARERGGAVVGDARMRSRAGTATTWIEWKHRAVGEDVAGGAPDGDRRAVHSVGRDITDRKSLERDLLHSEQRYRSLFEHMQIGFGLHELIRDDDGVVVDLIYLAVNAQQARLLKFDADRMVGRRMSELIPQRTEFMETILHALDRVEREGKTISFEGFSHRFQRWTSIVAYKTAPGQVAALTEDITEGAGPRRRRSRRSTSSCRSRCIRSATPSSRPTTPAACST